MELPGSGVTIVREEIINGVGSGGRMLDESMSCLERETGKICILCKGCTKGNGIMKLRLLTRSWSAKEVDGPRSAEVVDRV